MNEPNLLPILARGEDSRHQFKRDETNADSIAAELAAFANSGGGLLLLFPACGKEALSACFTLDSGRIALDHLGLDLDLHRSGLRRFAKMHAPVGVGPAVHLGKRQAR